MPLLVFHDCLKTERWTSYSVAMYDMLCHVDNAYISFNFWRMCETHARTYSRRIIGSGCNVWRGRSAQVKSWFAILQNSRICLNVFASTCKHYFFLQCGNSPMWYKMSVFYILPCVFVVQNELVTLSDCGLEACLRLTVLELRDNKLQQIPAFVAQFKGLKVCSDG